MEKSHIKKKAYIKKNYIQKIVIYKKKEKYFIEKNNYI